jgi:hypothetical protein
LLVQSPALETTIEYPLVPGSRMVAKLCQSMSGLEATRVNEPGRGVSTHMRLVGLLALEEINYHSQSTA